MNVKTKDGKTLRIRSIHDHEALVGQQIRGWLITGYLGRNPENGKHWVQAICPRCNEGCRRYTCQLREGAGCADCALNDKRVRSRLAQQKYDYKHRIQERSRGAELRQQKAYRKIMLDLQMKQAYLDHAVACRRNDQKPEMPAEWLEEYEAVTAHPEEAPRFSIPVGPSWPSTLTWAMGERD